LDEDLLEAGDDGGELDEALVDLLPPLPLRDDVVLSVRRRRHGSRALCTCGSPRRWRRPGHYVWEAVRGGGLRRQHAVASWQRRGGAEVPAHRKVVGAAAASGRCRCAPGGVGRRRPGIVIHGGAGRVAVGGVAGAPAARRRCRDELLDHFGRVRGLPERLERGEGRRLAAVVVADGGVPQRVHRPLLKQAQVLLHSARRRP